MHVPALAAPRTVGLVAHISGQLHIDAPPELVFDTVADSRNEPSFNPQMRDVELLTPPPIGAGTRFLARMGKRGTEMHVVIVDFDRPHRLRTQTTSSMMTTSGSLTFTPSGDGTLMAWDWQVQPTGWLRVLGPLFAPVGGRVERGIWTGLKRHLEDAPSA